jgi:plastocyanin
MLKNTLIISLVLAALGIGLAACGGYGTHSQTTAAAKATITAPPIAAAKVSVQDNTFKPGTIHAKVGDTITWTNDGAVAHTVTATDGANFDSGTLEPGKTFSFAADKAGTIHYVCNFHAGMQGTIEVR